MLHEAFHLDLMRASYVLYGDASVALWLKKPEDMTTEELMDFLEDKAQNQAELQIIQHEYIASCIAKIAEGLRQFSLQNVSTHSSFNDFNFYGLAYEGVHTTQLLFKQSN